MELVELEKYEISAAGSPWHIFFSASRKTYSENIAMDCLRLLPGLYQESRFSWIAWDAGVAAEVLFTRK